MQNFIVFLFLGISISQAESLNPANFHKDKRAGQVNAVTKITSGTHTDVLNLKFCFSSSDLRAKDYDFSPGCTTKKILDTEKELKYESICKDTGTSTYYWKRLSENEFEATVTSAALRLEQRYSYQGPVCDADAIRK